MIRWPLRKESRVIRDALAMLQPRERRLLLFLIPPTLFVAMLEVLGIASLAPFIALLSEPERFMKHRVLRWLYIQFSFSSQEDLFFCVGLCILALLVLTNVTAAATNWAMVRYAWTRSAALSTRMMRSYLYRPYSFFLERNTSELMRRAWSDAHTVAMEIIFHMITLIARLFSIALIAGTLFFIEPYLAAGAMLIFGGCYGTLFAFTRRYATKAGRIRTDLEIRRFKTATDALNGAKEVKLYRLEEPILARFWRDALAIARNSARHSVITMVPRYALETVAFGGVLVMMLYLLKTRHGLSGALPALGLYTFAAMRLLPSLQAVFGAINSLRYHSVAVDAVGRELREAAAETPIVEEKELSFEREIRFDNVCFSYARSPRPVLDKVSFTVRHGEWIGLVGPTGSGKSTLVDILLGFFEPTSGTLTVDGVPLTADRQRAWQRHAGYVPQQIFLVDDTVAANICFAAPSDKIDTAKLEKAARIAQIHDFITKELEKGYQTVIGDRGIRLSGGQRQRLGIARALYRGPSMLVLDEATSALDGATEQTFFQSLREELRDVTVVSITHRISTTRYFDRVYRLEGGVLLGEVQQATLAAEASAEQSAH